jgi:medium-chain acyl-[acyl-carrier-protein] hydrolase
VPLKHRLFRSGWRTGTPKARLFCFPHGGATALAYRAWQPAVGGEVEIVAVEPPGRGSRASEPLESSIDRVVTLLTEPVLDYAGNLPYAVFGHSMGALMAFHLALEAAAAANPPKALVVSACPPPGRRAGAPSVSGLSDDEFIEHVASIGGTPPGMFDDPLIAKLLLPVLRADFLACETYRPPAGRRVEVPLLAVGGSDDQTATPDDLAAWGDLSCASTTVRVFPGNHFYLVDYLSAVVKTVLDHMTYSGCLG